MMILYGGHLTLSFFFTLFVDLENITIPAPTILIKYGNNYIAKGKDEESSFLFLPPPRVLQ